MIPSANRGEILKMEVGSSSSETELPIKVCVVTSEAHNLEVIVYSSLYCN